MTSDAESLGAGSLRIGSVAISGRAFLAPMSGVTDLGMRREAAAFGASLVITEMVASDDYLRGGEESRLRAAGEGLTHHVVQIAGCDPTTLAEAARLAEASGAHIIDINMGCPAKRVVGGYAGSALMRDLTLALRLIEAVVAAVRVPVTLKTRLGWDDATLNAPELARRAEAAGVAAITIHGRTRAQFYKGRADWAAIRAVRRAVRVPLIANGDGATLADARAMRQASGADAVMIGRAAIGRPWLVGSIAAGLAGRPSQTHSPQARRESALRHFETLLEALGPRAGLRHARKHLAAYCDHGRPATDAAEADRLRLVTTDSVGEARALLAAAFAENRREAA